MLRGNICALLAAKDHVNVFLYDGAIDPEHIITGGHDNTTARTVAIREGEPINGPLSGRCSGRSSSTIERADGASSRARPSDRVLASGHGREGSVHG